jgi:hypothetical protein
VLTVIDMDAKQVVAVDRFNQVDWATQRARVWALNDRWQVDSWLAELNSIGSPNIEALQEEGLSVEGFTTTNQSKAEIIQALALAFERGEITIPDYAPLVAELNRFESTRLASGRWRYEAPAGQHDDCVISLALAWNAANAAPVLLEFI